MENPPNTPNLSPVLEWRIENFSCWMNSTHQNAIICRESSLAHGQFELLLFPRGEDGQGESLEVIFGGSNMLFRDDGDLLFVGPDGSILYTRRINQVLMGIPNRVLGPKFLDVVSLIEQKEYLHGDHLTLKFQYSSLPENRIYIRTTLEVLDRCFQITPPLDDGLSCMRIASVLYHNCESDVNNGVLVTYHPVSKTLHLEPFTENRISSNARASIQCQLNDYDKSNVLVRQKKSWFIVAGPRVIDSLSTLESGGHSILRLKIINGNYSSHCCDFFQSSLPLIKNASKNNNNAFSLVKSNSSFSLSEDLRCLYQDGEFPDFQLKCGTVSFPVHRNILRARSPFFKTMLSGDMKEAGSVDIEDLDVPSLNHFLTFLYTGTFKNLPCDCALKLYCVADKYQVPSLKEECAEFLCNQR